MSARLRSDTCDLLHDSFDDCSDARVPDDAHRQVINLLGWGQGRSLVRLTHAQWAAVARIVEWGQTKGTAA